MADVKEDRTVISAIAGIIKAASYEKEEYGGLSIYYRYDAELMEEVREDAEYLADKMAITPKQAVLFSLIIEMSKCDELTKRDLAENLNTSFVELLSYEDDLKALERALIIKRGGSGKIRVGGDVLKCLEKNMAFRRPSNSGLKTLTILSRMTRLFQDIQNESVDKEIALSEMDAMILLNPGTSIAKTANLYGVLLEGAKADERYNESYGWGYHENYDYQGSMCPAERIYNEEDMALQKNKVITYASRDGIRVKDHFKIEDSVKEEIFDDCGGLHEEAPFSGLLKCDSLVAKPLFYDAPIQESLSTLYDLLSESRYAQVKKALEDKGMRSGFTCLFYGSPGTGKTETVYQLAKGTKRDIITADVSKLKSMWVGESEKNLRRLFANYKRVAQNSSVTPILLFNEADAIFGIRKTAAEGAVDKMENSLQNIILQEMEDLKGILIATTNLTENLDKAFERRFLYKVKFNTPSITVKCQIWKALMPELSDTDARYLAEKFDFSGGQIENVVRKRTIQSILTGNEPDMQAILTFCSEELLETKRLSRRIGF